MKGFNLSDWALRHQSFVWYLMFVALLMGVFSYMKLGREEDPSFAIKTMVIQTRWPGATTEETLRQVTERVEKKLEELSSVSVEGDRMGTLAAEALLQRFNEGDQAPKALRIDTGFHIIDRATT